MLLSTLWYVWQSSFSVLWVYISPEDRYIHLSVYTDHTERLKVSGQTSAFKTYTVKKMHGKKPTAVVAGILP